MSCSDANGALMSIRHLLGTVLAVAVVVVVAVLAAFAATAESAPLTRATSNDGGAWVVNRGDGFFGHQNWSARELSVHYKMEDGLSYEVHQARDLVVVHHPNSNWLREVDTRTSAPDLQLTELPEFSKVVAVDGAVIVWRASPLSVWRVRADELPTLKSVEALTPLYGSAEASGVVAASANGRVAVVDETAQQVVMFDSNGAWIAAVDLPNVPPYADVTIIDSTVVTLSTNGDIAFVHPDHDPVLVKWNQPAAGLEPPVVLQQPATTYRSNDALAASVVAVTVNGALVRVTPDASPTATPTVVAELGGQDPLAPIEVDGCVYSVVQVPAWFAMHCDQSGVATQAKPLEGEELRLRLVNGWVWVNVLDDGVALATQKGAEIRVLDDWSLAIEAQAINADGEDAASEGVAADDALLVSDPDAGGSVSDGDEFNVGQENVPPTVVDDVARTRRDRPVAIPVLANDSDLNNDVLLVTGVEAVFGQVPALISVSPSGDEVLVAPLPGFVGEINLSYFVSDGRSEPVAGLITVTVSDSDENNAPQTTTDVVSTAPGTTTTVNVLANDLDPDGDPIALLGISTETGTLRWAPTGQVSYTPDPTTAAGWLELPYTVIDDLGATADGLLRVEIRDREANQEPDARNDLGVTVVSRPIALDLLGNDSDPDGDALVLASRPTLLSNHEVLPKWTTSPDGEFSFVSDEPGSYLFSYTITDLAQGGGERDTARIRVDVRPLEGGQRPVATRDDVVIPVGETRDVYVLENDGDPDGDVVGIIDWQGASGLAIDELFDPSGHVGFRVTVLPGASSRPSFTYTISDGTSDAVSAAVVVAVVDVGPRDQPPIGVDDFIEVRRGRTLSGLPVLANDFDPEGGSLRIASAGEPAGVDVSISPDLQTLDLGMGETTESFSFAYDLVDGAENRASAIVRVQLIHPDAANRAPVARTDVVRTSVDTSVVSAVLDNDSDPDSDAIVLEGIASQPEFGSALINQDDMTIVYRPDPGFSGTDLVRYTVVDSLGGAAVGNLLIGVMPAEALNLPPIANDDSYTIGSNATAIPLDVLANDSDPESDPLRITAVSDPSIGEVSVEAGRVVFEPSEGSRTADQVATFTYTIDDTNGNTATATVTVAIPEIVTVPTATPTATATPLPLPTTLASPDTAPTPEPTEVLPEAIAIPSAVPTAEPTPTPTTEPTATPAPETIQDQQGADSLVTPGPSATSTPTVTATPDERAPVASDDRVGPVAPGVELTVAVLENDFDPKGGVLRVVDVGGLASISGSEVTLTAPAETVEFSYTIADSQGTEASATITVLVTDNGAPIVESRSLSTAYETELQIDLSGTAVDPDGDDLFFACCESIRGGGLSNVAASANRLTLTFTPDDGHIGAAGFAFRVDDQNGHQVAGTVTIDVRPPDNQAPVAAADTIRVPQGSTEQVDLTRLASDPDNDGLTFSAASATGAGIDSVVGGTVLSVSAASDAAIGPAGSITYTAADGVLEASATISVEVVAGANERPTASDSALTVAAGSGENLDLATLVSDPDPADSLTFSIDDSSAGAVAANLVGSVLQLVAPVGDVGATGRIVYAARDERGEMAEGVVSFTVVEPTAPAPSAVRDTGTTTPGSPIDIAVLDNDVDPLGNGLTVLSAVAASGEAAVVSAGQAVRFIPGVFVGATTVTYTIEDAAGRQATATIDIETLGVPDAPAPPRVTADAGQATITWTTPLSNGSPITGYTVTASTGASESVGVVNSFVWTGLANGTTYSFTVTANNALGSSPASTPSLEVTPNVVPEAPAPPTVEVRDGALLVNWNPPTNQGSSIQSYEIEVGGSGAGNQVVSSGSRSFEWLGLANGEQYTFRIRASNDAGFGPWSGQSASEHPEGLPGAPVIGVTVRGGLSGALVVSWSPPVDDGGGDISEYRVTMVGGPSASVSGANVGTYEWSNLEVGIERQFTVEARNRAGWGPASQASVPVAACGAPGAPGVPSVTRGDGQVAVSFAPANDNGCSVTSYTISSSAAQVQNTTDPGHTFTGLTNGTTYTFTAFATNVFGAGPVSGTSVAVVPAGPPICSGAVTASATGVGQITVSWGAAIDNGASILNYEIDSGAGWQTVASPGTSTVVGALGNGSTYTTSVRAVNDVGTSPTCGSASATTWDRPSPVQASLEYQRPNLIATVSGGASPDTPITRWSAVFTNESPTSGSASFPSTFTTTPAADGVYNFSVEVCNAVGCQTTSQNLAVTLAAPPDQMALPVLDWDYPGEWYTVLVFATAVAPNDNGSPITAYETEWSPATATFAGSATLTSVPQNQYFGQLANNTANPAGGNGGNPMTWTYRVRAVNAEGPGLWSPWASVTPPVIPDSRSVSFGPHFATGNPAVRLDGTGWLWGHSYPVEVRSSTGLICTSRAAISDIYQTNEVRCGVDLAGAYVIVDGYQSNIYPS